jgi:metal-dependent HD superfamily phosphatase/phosphodiesterase
VQLGVRLVDGRAGGLEPDVRAELLHAIASHHDRNAARTAEAAVLYHANQLDAQAATRPVGA